MRSRPMPSSSDRASRGADLTFVIQTIRVTRGLRESSRQEWWDMVSLDISVEQLFVHEPDIASCALSDLIGKYSSN